MHLTQLEDFKKYIFENVVQKAIFEHDNDEAKVMRREEYSQRVILNSQTYLGFDVAGNGRNPGSGDEKTERSNKGAGISFDG